MISFVMDKTCTVEGCLRIRIARGWCEMHYARWRAHGDPNVTKQIRHKMRGTGEFYSWQSMIQRCTNPNNASYRYYGGRGIKVCDRWRTSFIAFHEDMGSKPDTTYSIERIHNDGNYEPSNCKWATPQEQANNKRGNRLFTINGEIRTMKEWTVHLGKDYGLVSLRVQRGWPIEKALMEKPC